jgi:hypothetical protein
MAVACCGDYHYFIDYTPYFSDLRRVPVPLFKCALSITIYLLSLCVVRRGLQHLQNATAVQVISYVIPILRAITFSSSNGLDFDSNKFKTL